MLKKIDFNFPFWLNAHRACDVFVALSCCGTCTGLCGAQQQDPQKFAGLQKSQILNGFVS